MSVRTRKKKTKASSEPAPLIEDPLEGAALPSHIASLLTFDKMLQREEIKQYDVSMLEQNVRRAEERAIAEGRDPRDDESVQQFRLFQLQRAEDEAAIEKLLAHRSRATYAHSAAMSAKSTSDPTHAIPSMRLAKRTYWPTRRVPDDQTAHVMWARTASILNKYYQVLSMQQQMSGEGGRRTMHMPRYHDYEKWIEQHFRVPVVLVRRNATARQTWLGHQDRQPTFYMQRPFDVPMPQSNHHQAFQNASSQNDDLLHEVRYLNMLELTALALLSTSRPGACFEFEWDGTLPTVDMYDLRPDNAPHKFVWDERKAREYSGDREQAARYVAKNFPEQRVDVYETFLRFDSESFDKRAASFKDDPDEFWVPQNRELLFDQFYVHANTFEDPMEDAKSPAETHAEVLRMFARVNNNNDDCGDDQETAERQQNVFPTLNQVLALLESGHQQQHRVADTTKHAWSERRRTSPYKVVVDQKERDDNEQTVCDADEFPYDVLPLEEYTLRRQTEEIEQQKKEASSFRYRKANMMSDAESNAAYRREGPYDAEFEESANKVPSETLRRNQRFAELQREKERDEWLLDDITGLPYYRDLYNNLEKVAGPEWALPTSDTSVADGGNRPARLTKYQYVRAFLYLAVRTAKQLYPEASSTEIAELVLPTTDRNAMSDIRQWLSNRRKQQRQTPNFRAWSADILKAIDVWMTRVCEAVEFCYHNDPGPVKRTTPTAKTARTVGDLEQNRQLDRENRDEEQQEVGEEKKRQRTDMWRRVEALFPPGIVSVMPEAWRKNEPVPPLPCDQTDANGVHSRKQNSVESLEHPDAFGVPKIAQVDRLYQELFLEEPRDSDWIEARFKGTGMTQYWEDRERQEMLSRSANGAPSRKDRLNPLLCSRHFRSVVLPAGGGTLPAWSQREHWLPFYYAEEQTQQAETDSVKEQEWKSVALVYDSVSQLLFPERRGAKQSRGARVPKSYRAQESRKNTVTRIGGSKAAQSPANKKSGLSALLASSSKSRRGRKSSSAASKSATSTDDNDLLAEDDESSPLQWNWTNYRDEAFLRGATDHDTLSPFEVLEKLKRADAHYEKRHPNLVHGDVFALDDGSANEHIDALFSVVTEPLMDARHLHTHEQVDMRGQVDNESNRCFAESVQRPLNHNPFHRFFHLFLTTCSANDLPQVSVDEWEQIEQFSRRVLHAMEPLEFDQSRLYGDDRFVGVAVDGRLRANQKALRATGEQPLQVQAGTRAMQTLSYAFRSARFAKVIERVETMLCYVPWIHRENVLQPFFDQDAPFSTLYDYGVNACVSLRDNARFHPSGAHPHAPSVLTSSRFVTDEEDRSNRQADVLRQAATQQATKQRNNGHVTHSVCANNDQQQQRETDQSQKEKYEDEKEEREEEENEEDEEDEDMWDDCTVTVDTVSDRQRSREDALQKLRQEDRQKTKQVALQKLKQEDRQNRQPASSFVSCDVDPDLQQQASDDYDWAEEFATQVKDISNLQLRIENEKQPKKANIARKDDPPVKRKDTAKVKKDTAKETTKEDGEEGEKEGEEDNNAAQRARKHSSLWDSFWTNNDEDKDHVQEGSKSRRSARLKDNKSNSEQAMTRRRSSRRLK